MLPNGWQCGKDATKKCIRLIQSDFCHESLFLTTSHVCQCWAAVSCVRLGRGSSWKLRHQRNLIQNNFNQDLLCDLSHWTSTQTLVSVWWSQLQCLTTRTIPITALCWTWEMFYLISNNIHLSHLQSSTYSWNHVIKRESFKTLMCLLLFINRQIQFDFMRTFVSSPLFSSRSWFRHIWYPLNGHLGLQEAIAYVLCCFNYSDFDRTPLVRWNSRESQVEEFCSQTPLSVHALPPLDVHSWQFFLLSNVMGLHDLLDRKFCQSSQCSWVYREPLQNQKPAKSQQNRADVFWLLTMIRNVWEAPFISPEFHYFILHSFLFVSLLSIVSGKRSQG